MSATSLAGRRWVGILFVLVILGAGAYFYQRARTPEAPHTEEERMRGVLNRDRENLEGDSKATDGEIAGALVRLAQRGDPEARRAAMARKQSTSITVREGVARALGYYTDAESTAAILLLLEDAVLTVRVNAIDSLGLVQSPERVQLLRAVLAKSGVLEEEAVAAQASLIRAESSPSAKQTAIDALLKFAKESKSELVRRRALIMGMAYAPRDPRLLEELRHLLETDPANPMAAMALRHLSGANDPYVARAFSKLILNKNPQVRQAALQSIHIVCPANRWELLESILRTETKTPQLWSSALQAVRLMPNENGRAMLGRLVTEKSFDEQQRRPLRMLLAALNSPQAGDDPCEKRGGLKSASVPAAKSAPAEKMVPAPLQRGKSAKGK